MSGADIANLQLTSDMPESNCTALGEHPGNSAAGVCRTDSSSGAASKRTATDTSGNPGAWKSSASADAAHEMNHSADCDNCCVRGINQVVLVLQPDDSTQYVLLSEERALREAAAEQAARDAAEQGLVPVDPRDAAIVQAIADGDAAVQRVFQARLQASLHRSSRRFEDLQPAEEDCGRSQGDVQYRGSGDEAWLAQLEAADMALTSQLNSRDAALSARI